jgi:ABC-type branched-subunit amino acid transport system ATPase component
MLFITTIINFIGGFIMEKLINELYDYSQSFDYMPPRGDGAQLEAACEVHRLCTKITKRLAKQLSKNPDEFISSTALLLALVERMLLDKIDSGLTPEILEEVS